MKTPNYLDIYLDREGYEATTARIIEENAKKTDADRKIEALQAENTAIKEVYKPVREDFEYLLGIVTSGNYSMEEVEDEIREILER